MARARFFSRVRELAIAVSIVAIVVALGALIVHDAHAAELAPAADVGAFVIVLTICAAIVALLIGFALFVVSRDPFNVERSSLTRVRFECTCGWVGTRELAHRPVSMQCPGCGGVAISMRART